MAKNTDITNFDHHFGHFSTPYRHLIIIKTSLCYKEVLWIDLVGNM